MYNIIKNKTDYVRIPTLKEKQCEICYQWYSKKKLKGDICSSCLVEMQFIPDIFSIEDKKSLVKDFKNGKIKNIFRSLTQNDKIQLEKCSNCEWLRNIDYLNLKINCASPVCEKVV